MSRPTPEVVPPVPIAPNDPLLAVLASSSGPVEVATLALDSPGALALREAGVEIVVPLVAQGELIGTLNLGPRLSEQPYSTDDRRLLANLASQAAPALRVAQLVKEQQQEARQRERVDAELRVAQLIQQNFLPQDVVAPAGWKVDAFYRPAREVGGDFYDVIDLPDGRMGVIVGDVTDKGVPAALVMASARSILRAAAQRLLEPALVLERANDQLVPDIPDAMFATCLYGVLDPASGRFRFANAGHNLPVVLEPDGRTIEPRATGMPLGMLPGSTYDEAEVGVEPGGTIVLYSDALPEAHGPDGDMFGFGGVGRAVAGAGDEPMVEHLLATLERFTGPGWEQEDDLTFVVLSRAPSPIGPADGNESPLLEISVPSIPDTERGVAEQVVRTAVRAGLPPESSPRLGTAVAEAVMNAMEHGNGFDEDRLVAVRVLASDERIVVEIRDDGLAGPIPDVGREPDLDAKLRGDEPTRGWGLFLASRMVDEVHTRADVGGNVTELITRIGESHG